MYKFTTSISQVETLSDKYVGRTQELCQCLSPQITIYNARARAQNLTRKVSKRNESGHKCGEAYTLPEQTTPSHSGISARNTNGKINEIFVDSSAVCEGQNYLRPHGYSVRDNCFGMFVHHSSHKRLLSTCTAPLKRLNTQHRGNDTTMSRI